jgi:hypothetical protein
MIGGVIVCIPWRDRSLEIPAELRACTSCRAAIALSIANASMVESLGLEPCCPACVEQITVDVNTFVGGLVRGQLLSLETGLRAAQTERDRN